MQKRAEKTSWYPSNRAAYDLVYAGALGDVRKVVARDGHSGPKEIGVEPEFLAWLTHPELNGRGALFDFGMLPCRPDDLADGRAAPRNRHCRNSAHQAGSLFARG